MIEVGGYLLSSWSCILWKSIFQEEGGEMTKREGQEVIEILLTADSGCCVCVRALLKRFIKKYPGFINLAKVAYEAEFDEMLLDEEKN